MKAVLYYDENKITCEDIPKPTIQDGEILVRMRVCGICGGDLLHWYRKKSEPVVLGHEITGEIVELGDGVEHLRIGDRVMVHHHVACGTCTYCSHGDYIQCPSFSGNRIAPGGFAEYIRVSAPIVRGDVQLLPENVSFEYGSLTEPLACCLKGMSRTNLRVGDAIGIIGAGPAGIMNTQLARHTRGARTIVVSDMLESRREFAKRFGAHVTVDPARESFAAVARELTGGVGLDAVVVTVSSSRLIQEGIEAVRRGGVVMVYAPPAPGDALTIDPTALYFAEKHIAWSYTSSHVECRQALGLLSSGTVDLQGLITRTYPMEEAPQAFRAVETKEGMKTLITNA